MARNDQPPLHPAYQPPVSPAPAAAGTGTLVIKIKGPLLETSPTASKSPHLLIIIPHSGKVEIVPPTRVSENRRDNAPDGELLAVTYFWENVSVTFPNLAAGWHFVMIDTSLDDPRTHQANMTGSGQNQNDYNGAVEIKPGRTTTMQFTVKNFMSGKFAEPRIR